MKIFSDEMMATIILVLLGAFDFWTVKNVSGRLLVGLRWWGERQEDGNEKWVFECRVDEQKNNKVDSTFFWGGQFIATAYWLLITILKIISISNFYWMLVDGILVLLLGTNLVAYYKCSRRKPP